MEIVRIAETDVARTTGRAVEITTRSGSVYLFRPSPSGKGWWYTRTPKPGEYDEIGDRGPRWIAEPPALTPRGNLVFDGLISTRVRDVRVIG